MENVIKLAIEGGYRIQDLGFKQRTVKLEGFKVFGEKVEVYTSADVWEDHPIIGSQNMKKSGDFWVHITQITSDQLFWQALGKSLGWKHAAQTGLYHEEGGAQIQLGWVYHWHRFIGHLIEGKDAESFFEELMK